MSFPPNQPPKPPPSREKCAVDGCPHFEEFANGRPTGGYCAGHRRRKQLLHQGKLTVPFESPLHEGLGRRLESPKQALLEAAIAYADADDTDDELVARRPAERLVYAALRYAKAVRKGRRRR